MEVPAGHVNFRGSLPRSTSNVLEPILHPASRAVTIVLASRACGSHFDTQTLKNHPSALNTKFFVRIILQMSNASI